MCGLGWDNWHWENDLSQYLHWTGGRHDGNGGLICSDLSVIKIVMTKNVVIIWTMTMNRILQRVIAHNCCVDGVDDHGEDGDNHEEDHKDDHEDDHEDEDDHPKTCDAAKSLTTDTVAVEDMVTIMSVLTVTMVTSLMMTITRILKRATLQSL